MATLKYRLTPRTYGHVLASYRGPVCCFCKGVLKKGDMVVSKAQESAGRRRYHLRCARKLHIV